MLSDHFQKKHFVSYSIKNLDRLKVKIYGIPVFESHLRVKDDAAVPPSSIAPSLPWSCGMAPASGAGVMGSDLRPSQGSDLKIDWHSRGYLV